ncbi:MAG: ribosome small subunit-dependent GTPase A [Candidatus Handelsmanbacteria bacterium RIFCSPLOWO2_12_FULL_64_10]|uniref:Small ribosomal subunit biogenesis GTPase RsgA n=1 Tax=Handelsmanbacteria sp. (strain RIFCSPLOWO2_12_FULL_64_10) TaxID=1817868 RepID=A0A1F6CN38_HANXR|nr:MAG: ribosome small subunit-dependent GTPase A [Candidatus Handelsmanbacteria bacterium RIFCSPLOWO2_12_FULL_64_10]
MLKKPDDATLQEGRVVQEHLGRYIVSAGDRLVGCAISSKLRKALEYPTADPSSLRQRVIAVRRIPSVSPVALGDLVAFEDTGADKGMIYQVLNRRNRLSRRAAGRRPLEHTLIANLDLAILVFSIRQPDLHFWLEMLDRFLAICEMEEIPPLICLNKIDLAEEAAWRSAASLYERIGYRTLPISAAHGTGVESVREAIREAVSVFLGPSGTGKTTLLNALQPGLGLQVGEVSRATGRGRHTTSHAELFPLEEGGMVGDTPGLRELNLYNVDADQLHWLFPEMRPLIGSCRFRNCIHAQEPDCAIKAAVESGQIDRLRYQSYLRIRERP